MRVFLNGVELVDSPHTPDSLMALVENGQLQSVMFTVEGELTAFAQSVPQLERFSFRGFEFFANPNDQAACVFKDDLGVKKPPEFPPEA